jgi:hypothetical protein
MARLPVSLALVAMAGGQELARTRPVPWRTLELDFEECGGSTLVLRDFMPKAFGRYTVQSNEVALRLPYDAPAEPIEIELRVEVPPTKLIELPGGRVAKSWDVASHGLS